MSGWASTPPTRDHIVPTTGQPLEHLVGQAVHGSAELLLDAVHDRRGVGRDGAGVVGHEQRAALGGDLVEALPLDPVPAPVERAVDPAGQLAHVLRAAPLVDVGPAGVGQRRPARRPSGRDEGHRAWTAPDRGRPWAPSSCPWVPGRSPSALDGSGRGSGRLPAAVLLGALLEVALADVARRCAWGTTGTAAPGRSTGSRPSWRSATAASAPATTRSKADRQGVLGDDLVLEAAAVEVVAGQQAGRHAEPERLDAGRRSAGRRGGWARSRRS